MESLHFFTIRSLLVFFLFQTTARDFQLSELTTDLQHRLRPLRVFLNRDGTNVVVASLKAVLGRYQLQPDVVLTNDYGSGHDTVFVLRVHRRNDGVIWATASASFTEPYYVTRDHNGDVYII